MPDNNTTNKKPEPKYYAVIVMDEGCLPEQLSEGSVPTNQTETDAVFLDPAQTPAQWYQENEIILNAGCTVRGIIALSQTEAISVITQKNSYIPPVDNGEIGE